MAKKVYIDFELRYKEAVKNLDEMQKEYSKLEKQVDKTSESQQELGNILDTTTGGAVTKFKNLRGTLGNVIKSFKSLRVAILATGIGALVIALGSLVTMFQNSEEGQNKFAKLMTQIGVVTGNVIDIVSDFGNVMFNVFTGNFKAAGEALNEVTEGIKNFGEETAKEIKVAGELSDKRAKADKLERDLIVERAEATRKFNELREKAADKENFTAQERIDFLVEAGKIEEEITLKEIDAARLRFEAKRDENKLSQSTKEDLDEEARLKAVLIELEAGRLKKQKTLNAELTTNRREAKAEEIADENELAALKKSIREAEAVSEEDKRALELQKIDEHYQELIDKAIENNLATDELENAQRQAKLDKQAEFDAEDDKKKQEKRDKELADQKEQADAEAKIEAERRKQKEETFRFAVELAGSETRLGRALLLAKQVLLAKEAIMNFKANVVNATAALGNVSLTASEAAVETTASIAKAANVAPPPFNIPFILTALSTAATVMSAVKAARGKTKQVATGLGAGGGGGASLENISTPTISDVSGGESVTPQLGLAGGSGINQIAQAFGQQPPVQAFVVSGDVTTAQELDRNIITSASIG
jgi:hypothetical protein